MFIVAATPSHKKPWHFPVSAGCTRVCLPLSLASVYRTLENVKERKKFSGFAYKRKQKLCLWY